jgi:hypothetical protein
MMSCKDGHEFRVSMIRIQLGSLCHLTVC